MNTVKLSRRDLLLQGSAALLGLAWLQGSRQAFAFPRWSGEKVIPWLDQPPASPMPQVVGNLLQWEQLDSWLTPNDKFFSLGTTISRASTKRPGPLKSPAWSGVP
jgi:hypothetical protein